MSKRALNILAHINQAKTFGSDFHYSLFHLFYKETQKSCSSKIRDAKNRPEQEILTLYHEMEVRAMTTFNFTPREYDVAKRFLLAETYREAAHSLYVSVSTIQFHARNIFAKANVHGRYEFERLVRKRLEELTFLEV